MRSTIADIKQLFNVKQIAYNTTIENLAEGQFGIFPEGDTTSIASGATLPDRFYVMNKIGGRLYQSFDNIDKKTIKNVIAKDYVTPQVNIWETVIEDCKCIDGFTFKVNFTETELINRDGLTWTHSDFETVVKTHELDCVDCNPSGTYANHIYTKVLAERINAKNSPFYEAEVRKTSDNSILSGAALDAFIAANKDVNTDDDDSNDSEKLKLVVKSKNLDPAIFNNVEINYIYPRGVRIKPVILLFDGSSVQFTEIQPIKYEIGAGADMRAEEWDNMHNYTNINAHPTWVQGISVEDLQYQFENGKNYNTVSFEFTTDKVESNDGDKRLFGILLGTETTNVYNDLKTLFNA